jgi:hypothetical protein
VTLRYRTYGLNLSSDFPIPGLNQASDNAWRADVSVEFGQEPPWVRDAQRLPSLIVRRLAACEGTQDPAFMLTSFGEGHFFQLAYSDGTRFVVNAEATRVWGAAGASQTIEDLSTYFLGPVMGYVLRRRGVTALHASALCISGNAVVLMGAAGSGKSTTAAALALRGAPVLCEDIAAVEEDDEGFSIQPGYPRVCLWPESVEMLMRHREALPRITSNWEKCYLPLDGARARLETQKRRLGTAYVLAPRETKNAPRIEEVSSREVLLELVQNTYMNWLLDRWQRAEEFELLSRLVSQIPVRRVVPHGDPLRIGELCELIEADARRLLASKLGRVATASR